MSAQKPCAQCGAEVVDGNEPHVCLPGTGAGAAVAAEIDGAFEYAAANSRRADKRNGCVGGGRDQSKRTHDVGVPVRRRKNAGRVVAAADPSGSRDRGPAARAIDADADADADANAEANVTATAPVFRKCSSGGSPAESPKGGPTSSACGGAMPVDGDEHGKGDETRWRGSGLDTARVAETGDHTLASMADQANATRRRVLDRNTLESDDAALQRQKHRERQEFSSVPEKSNAPKSNAPAPNRSPARDNASSAAPTQFDETPPLRTNSDVTGDGKSACNRTVLKPNGYAPKFFSAPSDGELTLTGSLVQSGAEGTDIAVSQGKAPAHLAKRPQQERERENQDDEIARETPEVAGNIPEPSTDAVADADAGLSDATVKTGSADSGLVVPGSAPDIEDGDDTPISTSDGGLLDPAVKIGGIGKTHVKLERASSAKPPSGPQSSRTSTTSADALGTKPVREQAVPKSGKRVVTATPIERPRRASSRGVAAAAAAVAKGNTVKEPLKRMSRRRLSHKQEGSEPARKHGDGARSALPEGEHAAGIPAVPNAGLGQEGMISVRGPTAFDEVRYQLRPIGGVAGLVRPALRSSGEVSVVQLAKFIRGQLGLDESIHVVISCAGEEISAHMTLNMLVREVWSNEDGHLVLDYEY